MTTHNRQDEQIQEMYPDSFLETMGYAQLTVGQAHQIWGWYKEQGSSLLAEVEERVIGANEPDDGFSEDETVIEDLGLKLSRARRNDLRREQRQTLQAIRKERGL